MSTLSDPSGGPVAVTPHDTTPINPPRALFVGTGGNITLRGRDNGTDVVLKNIANGTILPVRPSYVRATGTTASDIVALY